MPPFADVSGAIVCAGELLQLVRGDRREGGAAIIQAVVNGHGQAAQEAAVPLAAERGIIPVAVPVGEPDGHPCGCAADRTVLPPDVAVIQNDSRVAAVPRMALRLRRKAAGRQPVVPLQRYRAQQLLRRPRGEQRGIHRVGQRRVKGEGIRQTAAGYRVAKPESALRTPEASAERGLNVIGLPGQGRELIPLCILPEHLPVRRAPRGVGVLCAGPAQKAPVGVRKRDAVGVGPLQLRELRGCLEQGGMYLRTAERLKGVLNFAAKRVDAHGADFQNLLKPLPADAGIPFQIQNDHQVHPIPRTAVFLFNIPYSANIRKTEKRA